MINITLTEDAQKHFADLLAQQEKPGVNLRMFVIAGGTAQADCGVSFCQPDENTDNDIAIAYPDFTVFIDKNCAHFLEDASIELKQEKFGNQLTLTAPNARLIKPGENASLEQRVTYALEMDVNPNLASHGGRVELIKIVDGSIAVLQFGGGCQGCGMVDQTLKGGVEQTLKEQFPELTEIRDSTDHDAGQNPFY